MNTTQYTTTDRTALDAYTEYHKQRTEAACYAHQVKQAEARQKRHAQAVAATAAFLGTDDGDRIFA